MLYYLDNVDTYEEYIKKHPETKELDEFFYYYELFNDDYSSYTEIMRRKENENDKFKFSKFFKTFTQLFKKNKKN